MGDVLLQVKGVSKRFGPTVALDNVDFTLRRGEVHGLIGENGSGKSTLTSIIAGIIHYDSGEMERNGEAYHPVSVIDAQAKGVAMIVQEMGTAPNITVAENIFIGKEDKFIRNGFVSKKAMYKEAEKALRAIGVNNIHPEVPTFTLNLEERKLIELAKAVYEQPEILIVDETSTALSQEGRNALYKVIENMRDQGKGVILISHDLEELMHVCTIMTVLRDGVIIGTLNKEEFDENIIKEMMVGRELTGDYYRSDYDGSFCDEVVLKAEHLTGSVMIENVSFELHRGEILGVGGLSGGGIHELGRLLFGLDKAIVGSVKLADGTEITSPSVAVKNKVGYVSKNRDEEAIMLQASIKNNIAISSLSELVKHGIIANKRERKLAEDTCRDMEVKCAGIEQQINNLSGGNKQKVSFGKWAGADAQILILDCLTTNQERLREARDIRKHIALVTSYISEANKEASYQS
jgi:ribose transport system ATP-binding protein